VGPAASLHHAGDDSDGEGSGVTGPGSRVPLTAVDVERQLAGWWERRRFGVEGFSVAGVVAARGGRSVAVVVPVKECAETIAGVLSRSIAPWVAQGLVDEVLVIDAASGDGTARVAADTMAALGWGAVGRVVQQDAICAELGGALGKGDAMWRGLQACGGELVCFMDGDTRDPSPDHLLGLIAPLVCVEGVVMVRGSFERGLDTGRGVLAAEGGRVTELMARPLLNLYEPLLSGFSQPLAGEFSARRDVLESLAFPVGYGVEIATLIDTLRAHGLDAIAECRLGSRQNRHQPLRDLGQMAYAVLAAVERRRAPHATDQLPDGRWLMPWAPGPQIATIPVHERPPIHERATRRTATGGP
jgi:glucosyl-3-phosphoglycerate synthase